MAECSSTGLSVKGSGDDATALSRELQDHFILSGQHKGRAGEEDLVQFRASSQSPWCQWELQKKGRAARQPFPCAMPLLQLHSSYHSGLS